jgi:NADPH:quinone reductase-like Zn-dependent oxidoreductase
LRDVSLESKSILIYGASGSVGTAAVQFAKHQGANVTGICSTGNVEMVLSLGADAVIDYKKVDVYSVKERFDIVYETVNKTEVLKLSRLLKPDGTLILGAALMKGMLQGSWLSATKKIKLIAGVAQTSKKDIEKIAQLGEQGVFKPVIDRTYPLTEMAEAHRYVEKGHKKGNVMIRV